jgi:hypothetical protein
MTDADIAEVATVVKTFKVHTKPVSVFLEDELLTGAACYIEKTQEVYALIGNQAFSLLYRADLTVVSNDDVMFEQIITLKHAKELLPVNDKQLLAISNTHAVIFQKDPKECEDIMRYFTPEN